jgi:hypothetical protein
VLRGPLCDPVFLHNAKEGVDQGRAAQVLN